MATTSLFTDIVGSTEKAIEVGDEAWAELLERHHVLVRAEIGRFGGEEMDTSGDGFFAIFPHPANAIAAADAIRCVVRPLGLRVRIGSRQLYAVATVPHESEGSPRGEAIGYA